MAGLPPIQTPAQLRDSYRRVMDRVAQAAVRSGRKPGDILVVAVTKTAAPEQIRQLVDLGHRDFGENRVQQLVQRVAQLEEHLARRRLLGETEGPKDDGPETARSKVETRNAAGPAPGAGTARPAGAATPAAGVSGGLSAGAGFSGGGGGVRWHMIGHLQRNKIKLVAPVVKLVHSVDNLRLAEELHAFGVRAERTLDVLLQVNISGQESKFGVAPPAAIHVAEQLDSFLNLRLRGLMAMAPYVENPEQARPCLARTAELFEEIRQAGIGGGHFNLLSMGMSGDYAVAIEEGANVVRIGRALFGQPAEEPEPAALPDRPPRRGGDDEEPGLEDAPVTPAERQNVLRENRAARER